MTLTLTFQKRLENIDESNHVTCLIGEREIDFLIDSGSPVNTISSKDWASLFADWQANKIKIFKFTDRGSRQLRGYGASQPLKVICSFVARITVKKAEKPSSVKSSLLFRMLNKRC